MARLLGYSVVIGLFAFFCGCEERDSPFSYEPPLSPYEGYKKIILQSEMDSTEMGRMWLAASDEALRDSNNYQTPVNEMGFFRAEEPSARGYRILPKLGQEISVQIAGITNSRARIFLDIFEEIGDSLKRYKRVISADSVMDVIYEVATTRPHIIRIQPELLVTTRYTVSIITSPTLAFPVSGKNFRAIGSVWGDPRDGGRRRHEGVDIFAKRGTPVIAAADGRVSYVGVRGLGGKVVWLRDNKRRQSIYYAHLDSQMVRRGQRITAGDTLGLVGNTGNARYTPPHLHFGIYRSGRGAVDPYPHVRETNRQLAEITSDSTAIGTLMRASREIKVYERASTRAVSLTKLPKDCPFLVAGATRNWFRIITPFGEQGYVRAQRVTVVDSTAQQLANTRFISASPDSLAIPIDRIEANTAIAVLGKYGDFQLVETIDGLRGWLLPSESQSSSASSAISTAGADQ